MLQFSPFLQLRFTDCAAVQILIFVSPQAA